MIVSTQEIHQNKYMLLEGKYRSLYYMFLKGICNPYAINQLVFIS